MMIAVLLFAGLLSSFLVGIAIAPAPGPACPMGVCPPTQTVYYTNAETFFERQPLFLIAASQSNLISDVDSAVTSLFCAIDYNENTDDYDDCRVFTSASTVTRTNGSFEIHTSLITDGFNATIIAARLQCLYNDTTIAYIRGCDAYVIRRCANCSSSPNGCDDAFVMPNSYTILVVSTKCGPANNACKEEIMKSVMASGITTTLVFLPYDKLPKIAVKQACVAKSPQIFESERAKYALQCQSDEDAFSFYFSKRFGIKNDQSWI